MAKSWNNTVPQGQAAQNFGQQLGALRQREYREVQDQERRARELAQSYRDNALAASSGQLWASQIGKLEQDHISEGMKYRGQGFDVYNPDPNDPYQIQASDKYLRDRRNIEAQREYRKGVESQYLKTIEDLRKGKLGEYRQEDIQALNDWVANTSLSDAYGSNMQPPSVRRQFNPVEAVKGVRAITRNEVAVEGGQKRDVLSLDREATRDVLLGSLLASPGGEEYLQELTNGIPIRDLERIPDTIEANREDIISEYNGNPQFREQLAEDVGIVSEEDPRFQQLVDSIAQERTLAKRRFDSEMNNLIAMSSTGLKLYDTTTPDRTEAQERRADQQLSIQQQRLNIQKAQQEGKSANNIIAQEGRDISIPVGEGTENESSIDFKNFINLPVAARNMVGIEAYNTRTGKMERLPSIADGYTTSGVGVIDNPPQGIPNAAALVTSKDDFGLTNNYIVDAEMLPHNLKGQDLELIDGVKNKAKSAPKKKLTAQELIEKYRR